MKFFERIPTRWLLTGAAIACLVLWAAPGIAQTSGNASTGKLLFEDTPGESGIPQLGSCTNCHTVQDRRSRIATGNQTGAPFADVSFDRAMSHFGIAIGGNYGGVMGQFSQLDTQQRGDLAAYMADTPKVTATDLTTNNTLAFVASAVGNAVSKNVTIRHSIATPDNLQITSVSLAGGTTAFVRSGSCNNVTRAPAGTCTFSVTYTPTSTASETKTLTVALQQGSATFTRAITLNGSVAGATPPPPPAPPPTTSDDSGGGALGWAWLSGLALAVATLARRRRS